MSAHDMDVTVTISSVEELDQALAELARLKARLSAMSSEHQSQRIALGTEHRLTRTPLVKGKEALEEAIQLYAEEHRKEVEGAELSAGSVSWRRTPPRVEFNESEQVTLQRVQLRGLAGCLRIRESLDRNALKKLGEAERRLVGITIVSEERLNISTKGAR